MTSLLRTFGKPKDIKGNESISYITSTVSEEEVHQTTASKFKLQN